MYYNFDVIINPPTKSDPMYCIQIYYTHLSRKDKSIITSETRYDWRTNNEEVIEFFQAEKNQGVLFSIKSYVSILRNKACDKI